MDPNVLRDQLTKLHEELRAAPRAAPGSDQLLGDLIEDIKQLMARTDASDTQHAGAGPPTSTEAAVIPAVTAPETRDLDTSLPDRLEKIAVLFEVDHPTLAASSRRLVDILGKVGL